MATKRNSPKAVPPPAPPATSAAVENPPPSDPEPPPAPEVLPDLTPPINIGALLAAAGPLPSRLEDCQRLPSVGWVEGDPPKRWVPVPEYAPVQAFKDRDGVTRRVVVRTDHATYAKE